MLSSSTPLAPLKSTAMPGFEKPDETPISVASGPLVIGDIEIDCAVLGDETRLLSDRGVTKAMGGKRGGSHWLRMKEEGAIALPPYISATNRREFIPSDLIYILSNPVTYPTKKSCAKANGLLATAFPRVLRVWEKAYEAGASKPQQEHIAKQAISLLKGFDEIAILALLDLDWIFAVRHNPPQCLPGSGDCNCATVKKLDFAICVPPKYLQT